MIRKLSHSSRSKIIFLALAGLLAVAIYLVIDKNESKHTSINPEIHAGEPQATPERNSSIKILASTESGLLLGELFVAYNRHRSVQGLDRIELITTKKGDDMLILKNLGFEKTFEEWDMIFLWDNEFK